MDFHDTWMENWPRPRTDRDLDKERDPGFNSHFNNVRELLISLEILNVSLPYLGGWYEGMHSTERRSSVFKLMEI